MNRVSLSDSGDWELVNDNQDIRGYNVVDATGQPVGTIDSMLLDTDRELVTTLVLDNGIEVAAADVTIGKDVVYLDAASSRRCRRVRDRLRRLGPRRAPRVRRRRRLRPVRRRLPRAPPDDVRHGRAGLRRRPRRVPVRIHPRPTTTPIRNRNYGDAEADLKTGVPRRPRLRRRPRGCPVRLRPGSAPLLMPRNKDATPV